MEQQASLLEQLLVAVLSALAIPESIIEDVVPKGIAGPSGTRPPLGPTQLHLTVHAADPFYPLEVSGQARNGLFLLEGFNSKGKTTLLINAAILLGIDWSDDGLASFLQGGDRYLEAGRRYQHEFVEGSRSGSLALTTTDTTNAITIEGGVARITTGKEVREFDLAREGWRLFSAYMRSSIHVEFIPQNRDFLRQVYAEVAGEIIHRFAQIEQALIERAGGATYSAVQRELQSLKDAVETACGARDAAHADLAACTLRLEQLRSVVEAQQHDPEQVELATKWAQVQGLLDDLELCQQDVDETSNDLAELRAAYTDRKRLYDIAAPELARLKALVRPTLPGMLSHELRSRLNALMPRDDIGTWLDFAEKHQFRSADLYRQLAQDLQQLADPGGATFPFHDELTGEHITSVGAFVALLGLQLDWVRDFSQLLEEPFRDFVRTVAVCKAIRTEGLTRLHDTLLSQERHIESKTTALADAQERLRTKVRDLAQLLALEAHLVARPDRVLARAQDEASVLDRVLGSWLVNDIPVNTWIEHAGCTPVEFWQKGGAEPAIAQLADDEYAMLTEEAQKRNEELTRAEHELAVRSQDVQSRPEIQYARAREIFEYIRDRLETFLKADFVSQGADFADLSQWQHPAINVLGGVDVYMPLAEGLRRLVTGRCGSYYDLEDVTWFRWDVTDVDLQAGTLAVRRDDQVREIAVRTLLGTGQRSAITVRSLASRTQPPHYLTVLLVDEWGDVHNGSLGQLLYEDLTGLPDPVVGLFTLPGSAIPPILIEAQQGTGQ